MSDGELFPEEFLKRLEAGDFDVRIFQKLERLTPEERSQLAEILLGRKSKRAAIN